MEYGVEHKSINYCALHDSRECGCSKLASSMLSHLIQSENYEEANKRIHQWEKYFGASNELAETLWNTLPVLNKLLLLLR